MHRVGVGRRQRDPDGNRDYIAIALDAVLSGKTLVTLGWDV
jgi:hypothetical protein